MKAQTFSQNYPHTALVALGSNLENPLAQCLKAASQIGALFGSQIEAISSFYSSKALVKEGMDADEVPSFVNGMVKVKTSLALFDFFDALQAIEKKMGRTPGLKWAPRIIDLDLIDFNSQTIENSKISLPHNQIELRDFVLWPLKDIASEYIHPISRKNIDELLFDYYKKEVPLITDIFYLAKPHDPYLVHSYFSDRFLHDRQIALKSFRIAKPFQKASQTKTA